MDKVEFSVEPIAPFRLDLTAWALRRRPTNSIDRFTGGAYGRVLVADGMPIEVKIVQRGSAERPKLDVVGTGKRITPAAGRELKRTVSEALGLKVDLAGFYAMSSGHPKLGALVRRYMGVKPPRFPSLFETLVNAIACQQVSLNVGLLLLSRLALKYGLSSRRNGERSFPTADALRRADTRQLRELGFSGRKAEYLLGLARSVSSGALDLDELHGMDDLKATEFLTQVRGVGRWSAEYTLLRGLGRLSVFPGDDVGGQNGLRRWMGLKRSPNYERVQKLLVEWKEFRGMVYFHLLLKGLEEAGCFNASDCSMEPHATD